MSETSSLSELARFVGKSKLNADNPSERRQAISSVLAGIRPKPQRHSVGELLGVVLVLSARTRRVVLPRVDIDIDVFTPDGGRAIRMILPRER